jgi:opacity protein-like surface antigen
MVVRAHTRSETLIMLPARRLLIPALGFVLAATSTPSAAHAQFTSTTPSTHHWLAVGFGGGEVIPTGNATTNVRSGFQGQGYVVVNLGILPELRFNVGYQRFNFKDQVLSSLGVPSATAAHNNVLAGIAGTRIDLLRLPIRPYITAGVGAFNFKTVVDTGRAGRASGSVTSASTTKFGLDGGAGLALSVGRVEAFAEGRVQNVFTDKGVMTSARQIQAIPVSFGIMYTIF